APPRAAGPRGGRSTRPSSARRSGAWRGTVPAAPDRPARATALRAEAAPVLGLVLALATFGPIGVADLALLDVLLGRVVAGVRLCRAPLEGVDALLLLR